MFSPRTYILFLAVVLFTACNKDPEQSGCSDPLAVNYDPQALTDDGSCTYNQATQMIWSDGKFGGWNEDYQEGSYRLKTCAGLTNELTAFKSDSIEFSTLFLSTDDSEEHRSVFSLINERDARDFAEGSLRFDARTVDSLGASPEFIRLFISGKLWQNDECFSYRRSDYVEIYTGAFTDSTFTEVNVPIRHFDQIMMARVEVVCGFEFEGATGTGIEINNLRWVANKRKD